jgi:cellulose synthase/poly-beta-1,6-N-acetylglucosamine synthase-like glycosyltransferase
LLKQDYPAYGVSLVVESKDDPAWEFLHKFVTRSTPVRVRVVVAGHGRDCGQKVHNLLYATKSLEASVDAVAFLDTDVCLRPEWLRLLVRPLKDPGVGAVTGYRWFVPVEEGWSSATLSALNGAVALLFGNHPWNRVWGGSWGIRRSTFEAASIRQAWQGAFTEDYPAWKAIREAGLRVVFEPGCLLASPLKSTWGELLDFARRQYLITRVYAPALWWLALLGELLFNVTFWGGLTFEVRNWFVRGTLSWITLILTSLYVLAAVRARIRQSVAALRFSDRTDALSHARGLDIWAQPLLALCNLGLILTSAFGRRITWRGIRYQLDGPGQTQILSYQPRQERPQ